MTATIKLADGGTVVCDAADLPVLEGYVWRRMRTPHTDYAHAYRDGERILMHRLLMNAPSHLVVDHKNRDGLDNRRANLRRCTQRQNLANRSSAKRELRNVQRLPHNSGVSYRANVGSQREYIGRATPSDIEAAFDADRIALAMYGEFGVLNFPLCHPSVLGLSVRLDKPECPRCIGKAVTAEVSVSVEWSRGSWRVRGAPDVPSEAPVKCSCGWEGSAKEIWRTAPPKLTPCPQDNRKATNHE